ncbi:MAG: alanine racemase [Lachnospiraceae bacterium]|nr:alanine racemase [Lachnospiraceae bacterium]
MINTERVSAIVNLGNIRNNILEISKHVPKGTGVMAVIKADGYGHGAVAVARTLADLECVYGYAVATIDEAMEIVHIGCDKPILILGYVAPSMYGMAITNEIRVPVFDLHSASKINAMAAQLGKKCKVHIKVDTGMGRIGIIPDDRGIEFVKQVSCMNCLEIEGIFTHFARADESDKSSANAQAKAFKDFTDKLEKEGIHIPLKHCSNSAAIIDMPHLHFDIVRSGIITYGLWPSDEVNKGNIVLKPAMEIKSAVIFIKDVPAGTPISYGGTYVTDKETRIATVSIGYADGFPRSLSNKGVVLIKGRRYKVIGRVCMDQLMVDIDMNDDIDVGDVVTVVGKDGDEEITMDEFALLSDRINYEAVCDIGKRVPRVYRRS